MVFDLVLNRAIVILILDGVHSHDFGVKKTKEFHYPKDIFKVLLLIGFIQKRVNTFLEIKETNPAKDNLPSSLGETLLQLFYKEEPALTCLDYFVESKVVLFVELHFREDLVANELKDI